MSRQSARHAGGQPVSWHAAPGVSYSLLTKAETGAVPATPALIGAVARALGVDVTRITGQPYEEPGGAATLQAAVAPLRRALLAYDLPPETDAGPRPRTSCGPRSSPSRCSAGRPATFSSASACLGCSMSCRQRSRRPASRTARRSMRCWPRPTAAYPGSPISSGTRPAGADAGPDRVGGRGCRRPAAGRADPVVKRRVAARRRRLRSRPGADGTHPRRARRRRGRPGRA